MEEGIPSRGSSTCKGPGAQACWGCLNNSKEVKRGGGGLGGPGEDLSFIVGPEPQRVRSGFSRDPSGS